MVERQVDNARLDKKTMENENTSSVYYKRGVLGLPGGQVTLTGSRDRQTTPLASRRKARKAKPSARLF